MSNIDFHTDCSHCTTTKEPVWPIEDFTKWLMDLCHNEAHTEEFERNVAISKKEKEEYNKLQAERRKVQTKGRDQKMLQMSIIRAVKPLGGGNMAKNKLSKTGVLDGLIKADLEGSYKDGAKDEIVAKVLEQFPDLEAKALTGLFYSRRAVINKAAKDASVAA